MNLMPKPELQSIKQIHPGTHPGAETNPEEIKGPDSQKLHQSDNDVMETMFEYPSPT